MALNEAISFILLSFQIYLLLKNLVNDRKCLLVYTIYLVVVQELALPHSTPHLSTCLNLLNARTQPTFGAIRVKD